MEYIALDFDGVLCNSAAETAESAWRAGSALFKEWKGLPVPAEFVAEFRRVRPVLETGFEAIPLMRLVSCGVSRGELFRDFPRLRDRVIAEAGVSPADLVCLFGAARDQWIREDPDGWLARHEFYPGVIEALRQRLAEDELYILTTKQERFVCRLLQPVCPEFPQERIYGLDSGISKEDGLKRLVDAGRSSADCIHFVEDRLDTLERVVTRQDLADVRLYLASWGYARDEDVERARQSERIVVWDLPEFLRLKRG